MKSLTSATTQARLVWESELIDEAPDEASPTQDETVYVAAWGYWSAREALAEAKTRLLALDNRPLPPDSDRRRRRRGGTAGGGDAAARRDGVLGVFPKRQDTVIAEALARLLDGEKLTGMDGVFDCNTTRLADHVHQLRRRHGWRIESQDVQVRTNDGRSAQVAEYWLPPRVIEAAAAAGGVEFCTSVREARAKRRARANAA